MNGAETPAARARIARLAVTFACLGTGCADGSGLGCDEANGGAVELSWSLERPDGRRVERCDDVRVTTIRLQWGEGGPDSDAVWRCDDRSGITNFDVPAGDLAFWVEPVCADDYVLLPGTFEAPAPVVRHVEAAELVTLNAVLITVEDDCADGDDDSASSCSCLCGALAGRCPV